MIARQPAAVTRPQRARAVYQQHADVVAFQFRRIRRVKGREAHAVKPHNAFRRRQPEIAVRRLRDGADAVLRQAVLIRPDELLILTEEAQRADGLACCRTSQQTTQHDEPPAQASPAICA
jgi:hypothetical protein